MTLDLEARAARPSSPLGSGHNAPTIAAAVRLLALAGVLMTLAGALPARAQLGGGAVPEAKKLVRASAAPVKLTAGGRAEATFTLDIAPSWHINANPPSPDYMIPTEIELRPAAGVHPGRVIYPPPRKFKVGFEDSELSVYDGQVIVRVPLVALAGATNGEHTLTGVVRFQACNDQVCLAPAEVPVSVRVSVSGGAASAGHADSASSGGDRAPPAGATDSAFAARHATSDTGVTIAGSALPPLNRGNASLDNPLARAISQGGWGSFLTLFLIGLALNLTPCVYPMLGVTVSIFGARRAAPPLQVFALACVYVLGMAVMYSSLGLVAAFTGGLFGGILQNPIVLVGLGVLLIALSLSMFGVYELQPPPALLSRLGGNTGTSAIGVFFSGLVVGVFAAPCVGPPVVALLAVVGAKGDPWFGFSSFFVLAMGLGAPYLVLATFSNSIQVLPRSGEWMIWVKKVFGVILLALGAFYASLALAPEVALWIPAAALVLGGVYLGFFEKSGHGKPRFRWMKRLIGGGAAVAGIVMVISTPSTSEGIVFESFTPERLHSALASGQPAMLDFTANWCAPCHELERFTFTDRRVRAKAKSFRTFRVDLTRYNSPEAERWRREYAITGVPTIVFLTPEGREVHAARVTGFLSPEMFLERMHLATGEVARAARE